MPEPPGRGCDDAVTKPFSPAFKARSSATTARPPVHFILSTGFRRCVEQRAGGFRSNSATSLSMARHGALAAIDVGITWGALPAGPVALWKLSRTPAEAGRPTQSGQNDRSRALMGCTR